MKKNIEYQTWVKVTICDLKKKDSNMADNIEHQDKGELVAICDQFNSLSMS